MRFLVDEDLPRLTNKLLRDHGHEVIDVRDTVLRGAGDTEIAAYAREHQLCLLSADIGFADIRNYPPRKHPGIVVLRLPAKATSSIILSLLTGLLVQKTVVNRLKGKLAIVEFGRVRIRQD